MIGDVCITTIMTWPTPPDHASLPNWCESVCVCSYGPQACMCAMRGAAFLSVWIGYCSIYLHGRDEW